MYREFRLQPMPAGADRRSAFHLSTSGSVQREVKMQPDTTNVGFETQPGQVIRIVAYRGDTIIDTADFKINRDCPGTVQFFLKRDTLTVPVEPARVQTLLPTAVVPTPLPGLPPAPPAAPAAPETVAQKLAAGLRPVQENGKVVWRLP